MRTKMTLDEITTTLRAFALSRKSGCRARPEYNICGNIGCRMADEAARAIERVYGETQMEGNKNG
nr:MAG TPA: hypothetical protein [Caudoviricetes sp.]